MKIGPISDEVFDLPEEIIEKYKIGVARFKIDLQELKNLPGNIYQKKKKPERQELEIVFKK